MSYRVFNLLVTQRFGIEMEFLFSHKGKWI
jgi:hypothetical protein